MERTLAFLICVRNQTPCKPVLPLLPHTHTKKTPAFIHFDKAEQPDTVLMFLRMMPLNYLIYTQFNDENK